MASADRLQDIANESEIILAMYPKVYGHLRQAIVILESIRGANPEIMYTGPTPGKKQREITVAEAQAEVAILTRKIAVWPNRIERLAVAVDETLPGIGRTLRHVRRCLNPPWHEIEGFDWEPALTELKTIRELATRVQGYIDGSIDEPGYVTSTRHEWNFTLSREQMERIVRGAEAGDESGDTAGSGQDAAAAGDRSGQNGAGGRPKTRGRNINGAMLDTLQNGPQDARGWTVRKWAAELNCSVSTIQETKTWKELSATRKLAKAERALAKNRRSKGRPRTEQD
jgi:hypothetical protein